jgi:hypothetical protein
MTSGAKTREGRLGGFHGVLVGSRGSWRWGGWCSRRFWESVLWGDWPYLGAKPFHVGDWGDGPAYPMSSYYLWMSVWWVESLVWEGSSLLAANPFFGEVASLWAHVSPILASPRGVGLDSYHPYPRARKPLRRFTLLWWRRFESSWMTMHAMRVEGEEPFGSRLERFGVWCLRTFLQRVCGICGYDLLGGTRWSGP